MALSGREDPTLHTVLAEDSTALLGALIAAGGMALQLSTGTIAFEGIAALLIALLLAWTAYRAKDLLIGESASPAHRLQALDFLNAQPEIDVVLEVLTMRLRPSSKTHRLSGSTSRTASTATGSKPSAAGSKSP